MDDTALLAAVREADPATVETIARVLDTGIETTRERLAELESAGRVERSADEWAIARDPRIDASAERIRKRLDRERP